MNKKYLIYLASLIILVCLVAYSCFLNPEARVKKAIFQARDAVENEEFETIEKFFADDFEDHFGFTKPDLMNVIQLSLEKWKDIDIKIIQLEITITDDKAEARFHVKGEATRASTLNKPGLPNRMGYGFQNIRFYLAKRDGKWRLVDWANINSETWDVPMPTVNP